MRIITQRLVLERIDPAMARSMLAGRPLDGDVWAPGYPLADEFDAVRAHLGSAASWELDSPFGMHVIRTLADESACGGVGFFGPPDEHGAVDFGYGLVPAARGQGVATEAVRELLTVAADHGARTARADTDLLNLPSQAVLLRAGLREVRRDSKLGYWEIALAQPVR